MQLVLAEACQQNRFCRGRSKLELQLGCGEAGSTEHCLEVGVNRKSASAGSRSQPEVGVNQKSASTGSRRKSEVLEKSIKRKKKNSKVSWSWRNEKLLAKKCVLSFQKVHVTRLQVFGVHKCGTHRFEAERSPEPKLYFCEAKCHPNCYQPRGSVQPNVGALVHWKVWYQRETVEMFWREYLSVKSMFSMRRFLGWNLGLLLSLILLTTNTQPGGLIFLASLGRKSFDVSIFRKNTCGRFLPRYFYPGEISYPAH
jgi:hypothetical protein